MGRSPPACQAPNTLIVRLKVEGRALVGHTGLGVKLAWAAEAMRGVLW